MPVIVKITMGGRGELPNGSLVSPCLLYYYSCRHHPSVRLFCLFCLSVIFSFAFVSALAVVCIFAFPS